MPFRTELLIAARYMRPKKASGFVSVITGFSLVGIMLGVATLIVVMSVMNGFRHELLGHILGLNGHIGIYATQGDLDNHEALARQVRAIPGVVAVVPQVEGQAMVSRPSGDVAAGVIVRGVSPASLPEKPSLMNGITPPALQAFKGFQVLIGARLAERLQVAAGDSLTLVSPTPARTAFGIIPRYRSVTIAGTFEVGMYEYDNNFIFMELSSAREFFTVPQGAVHSLDVTLSGNEALAAVKEQLQTLPWENGLLIRDWQEANATFFSALQVERNVMFLILTLIIIVAAFNIISGLTMLVSDKARAIAILRTFGASQASIMRIFVLCGALIGVGGTLLGVLLGLGLAENIESVRQFLEQVTATRLFPGDIYFLTRLPAEVDSREVISVGAMGIGLSLLATLYPAWKAAQLSPAEVLRHG